MIRKGAKASYPLCQKHSFSAGLSQLAKQAADRVWAMKPM